MRSKRNFLIGVILGGALGWMLGFLRFPYVEENSSFLIGLIACFTIVALILYTLLIGKTRSIQNSKTTTRKYNLIWILLVLFLAVGGMFSSFFLYKQNGLLETQIHDQNKKIKELSEMIESAGSGNLASFMNNILDEVDRELKTNPNDVLSDTIIEKIAALSFSFKPYKYFDGDSLSEKKISPERGQLLLALILMEIDSVSFSKIKSSVTFSAANLNGADLHGVDLSNADLKGTHFKETNLHGANLSGANLSDANLYAANLNTAKLNGADLKRSDLRWAQLNDADLQMVDMNGAQMKSAQFINANLYKAKIQWADLSGAILHHANLEGVDLMGTSLTKVNLSEANLTNTDLRLIKLNGANLSATELNRTLVDSTWVDSINTWRLTGASKILQDYRLVNDTSDQWKNPLFRLNKIEEKVETPGIDSVAN